MERATALRAGASLLAAVAFIGADLYVVRHPKNANAPLQPPAVDDVAARSATPRPSGAPRATPSPRITLQPGVRATQLPGITYTHVS